MRGGNPNAPLLLMMGSVPLVVGLAVVVAVLLSRAGFGLVVALGIPFGVSMLAIIVLGVWLAGKATRRAGSPGSEGERSGEGHSGEGRDREDHGNAGK